MEQEWCIYLDLDMEFGHAAAIHQEAFLAIYDILPMNVRSTSSFAMAISHPYVCKLYPDHFIFGNELRFVEQAVKMSTFVVPRVLPFLQSAHMQEHHSKPTSSPSMTHNCFLH